jgi:hypothetical protein
LATGFLAAAFFIDGFFAAPFSTSIEAAVFLAAAFLIGFVSTGCSVRTKPSR